MTDETFAPFSNNPSNNDTVAGLLRLVLRKALQYTDDMLPAKVIAYNRASNMAQVQPMITAVTTTGIQLTRAQIAAVPVYRYGAGNALLRFSPVAGDLGWLKSNDRDISLFKQSYQNAPPNTKRLHSFEDAMFYPDEMTDVVVASEDAGNATLQTKDGTVRLAVWPNQIKITAPATCITDVAGYTTAAGTVLDVQSVSKAFKVPRMTVGQRDSIPSPIGGMIVYVTNSSPNPKFSFYTDGIGWS